MYNFVSKRTHVMFALVNIIVMVMLASCAAIQPGLPGAVLPPVLPPSNSIVMVSAQEVVNAVTNPQQAQDLWIMEGQGGWFVSWLKMSATDGTVGRVWAMVNTVNKPTVYTQAVMTSLESGCSFLCFLYRQGWKLLPEVPTILMAIVTKDPGLLFVNVAVMDTDKKDWTVTPFTSDKNAGTDLLNSWYNDNYTSKQ